MHACIWLTVWRTRGFRSSNYIHSACVELPLTVSHLGRCLPHDAGLCKRERAPGKTGGKNGRPGGTRLAVLLPPSPVLPPLGSVFSDKIPSQEVMSLKGSTPPRNTHHPEHQAPSARTPGGHTQTITPLSHFSLCLLF